MHIKKIFMLTIVLFIAFFMNVNYTSALEKNINYESDFKTETGTITGDESDVKGGCTGLLSPTFVSIMKEGYDWIEIFAVIIAVVMGMLDFGKAITSDDQDCLKKASKKFKTRLIVLVIIFITPVIIEPVVKVFAGDQYDVCGLNK